MRQDSHMAVDVSVSELAMIDVAGLEDAVLVQRVRQLDEDAVAEIVELYIDSIYTFCRSRVESAEQAATATRRTLVRAVTRLAWLDDPRQLQSWLFAIARVHTDGLAPSQSEQLRLAGEFSGSEDLLEAAYSRTFWSIGAELTDREHSILELLFRHGLGEVAIADILDVTTHGVRQTVQSSYDRIELTIGTLLLARHGRGQCPILDELLGSWGGRLDRLTRRELSTHAESCAKCAHNRSTGLSEVSSLGVLGATSAPDSLREDTIEHMVAGMILTASGSSIETKFAKRDREIQRAHGLPLWSWREDGFPISEPHEPRRALMLVVATVAFIVIVGLGALAGLASSASADPAPPASPSVDFSPLDALNDGPESDS